MSSLSPRLKSLAIGGALIALAAVAANLSLEEYNGEHEKIAGAFKDARARCDPLSGNARDVCMVQAKAERNIAFADLEQRYEPTPRHAERLAVVRAESAYDVARERCDDAAGSDRDACIRGAKDSRSQALAQAHSSGASPAHRDIIDLTRNAVPPRLPEYDQIYRSCQQLDGNARVSCMADARARFGRP